MNLFRFVSSRLVSNQSMRQTIARDKKSPCWLFFPSVHYGLQSRGSIWRTPQFLFFSFGKSTQRSSPCDARCVRMLQSRKRSPAQERQNRMPPTIDAKPKEKARLVPYDADALLSKSTAQPSKKEALLVSEFCKQLSPPQPNKKKNCKRRDRRHKPIANPICVWCPSIE